MYSLFYVATAQHGEEFAPVRCDRQTLYRLVRYFEDVVIENKLAALVLEGRCLDGDPARDGERLARLAATARYTYLFTCDPTCLVRTWKIGKTVNLARVEERDYHKFESGPFVLVMEPRFCGMLASYAVADCNDGSKANYEMIWTFDPNVVFTAIEYLMARIGSQRKDDAAKLAALVRTCTPHSPSLRLALSLTTKLTTLMQQQNEREMAINSISAAISSTLDLDKILQSAVNEVGIALKARRSALVLWEEGTSKPENMTVYERPESSNKHSHNVQEPVVSKAINGSRAAADRCVIPGSLDMPVRYRDQTIGVLLVEDDTPGRSWEDEEVLMAQTVSDQLAVAISNARLFKKVETQAITDPLTGLFNHRYFQDRLEREMRVAERGGESVSLILLDLDHLKRVNDSLGHRAGDACLRHVARTMQSAVREIDICARYGGEEFVIVLPKCDQDGAMLVAERVRESIAGREVENVGCVTASIGVATYPGLPRTREELIELADRAMYYSKSAGRNRVSSMAEKRHPNPMSESAESPVVITRQ